MVGGRARGQPLREGSTQGLEAVEGAALGESILPLAPHADNGLPESWQPASQELPKIVE